MRLRFTLLPSCLLLVAGSSFLFNACTKTKRVTVTDTVGNVIPMGPIRPTTGTSHQYVTTFCEYNPAPGQFLNTSLADSAAAAAVVGNTQGLVSLGAFGGYQNNTVGSS